MNQAEDFAPLRFCPNDLRLGIKTPNSTVTSPSDNPEPQSVPAQFKHWTIPGPIPPGRLSNIQPGPGESLDSISGHFRLFQLKAGHRFSTDDLLTAYYGTSWCPRAARVLDLGSGIGTVAMVAAWRLPGAFFVTIEAQRESAALARRSAEYNGLTSRFDIREGDFRQPEALRSAEAFDLILGSPPYFPEGTGVIGDHPQKIACRFELRGDVTDYCSTAAMHLAPGGMVSLVFQYAEDQRRRVQVGAQKAGLAIFRERPVVLREGDPPLIGLFALMRADNLPPWFRGNTHIDPPLLIRTRSGDIHPEYSALKMSIGFPP